MLDIGLIGAGNIARLYVKALEQVKLGKIGMVYAPDQTSGEMAELLQARPAASPSDIFDETSIGTVIIASPVKTHCDYIAEALAAGKNVFCSSPVVLHPDEAARVRKAMETAKCMAAADLSLRYIPEFIYLKEQMAENVVGRIGTIRLSICLPWRAGGNEVQESDIAAPDVLARALDYLEWAFGTIRRITSFAAEKSSTGKNEYVLAAVRMDSGAIAHIEASRAEANDFSYLTYEVAGSQGIIDYDSRVERALVIQDKHSAQTEGYWETSKGKACQLHEFLKKVEQGNCDTSMMEAGLKAALLAHAAAESGRNHQPVNL